MKTRKRYSLNSKKNLNIGKGDNEVLLTNKKPKFALLL